jgi:hypothetical protein
MRSRSLNRDVKRPENQSYERVKQAILQRYTAPNEASEVTLTYLACVAFKELVSVRPADRFEGSFTQVDQ